jgi:hypothetical protein
VPPPPAKSKQSAALYDLTDVDPTWAAPSEPPLTTGRKAIPASLLYGCILLALVLAVVAVWGFGGFKKRTDLFKTTPPGTLFTTGPYEFRFTEATAQHKKDFGAATYWEVVAIGEGRTTGKESIAPNFTGDSTMFASKDDVSQEVELPQSLLMGGGNGFNRQRFTPGLPLTRFSVVFKYQDTYRSGRTFRFAVFDQVYGKHLIASEEEVWHNGTYARQFYLPLRVLPEEMD